jgi:hypothetical protein
MMTGIIMWAIVCMISVGIHGLGTTSNIIIIIVGNIERLRLAIIRGWSMKGRGKKLGKWVIMGAQDRVHNKRG